MTLVTNVGISPVEAAGRVFPPRRTVEVDLTEAQVAAVAAHRRLRFAGGKLDDRRVDEGGELGGWVLDSVQLVSMTVEQLRAHAAEHDIDLGGAARKAELIEAIAAACADTEPEG